MHKQKSGLRVAHAKAVATGLREAAGYCNAGQEGLRARLSQAAETIDEVVSMLEQAEFAAKLNQETIREMVR